MNIETIIAEREPTLADLIQALDGNDRLSKTRRRDLISAVKTTARLLNRNPPEIPAEAKGLRERLARIHPTQANMTGKRLANVKSDLAAALKLLPTKRKVRIREGGYPRTGVERSPYSMALHRWSKPSTPGKMKSLLSHPGSVPG